MQLPINRGRSERQICVYTEYHGLTTRPHGQRSWANFYIGFRNTDDVLIVGGEEQQLEKRGKKLNVLDEAGFRLKEAPDYANGNRLSRIQYNNKFSQTGRQKFKR